jgi:penicillin-binding protein 1C
VALQALRQQLAELQGRNVEDGAVVVLDNASGEVLAWVGHRQRRQLGAAAGRRRAGAAPAGSTLKPFVYGLAFESG